MDCMPFTNSASSLADSCQLGPLKAMENAWKCVYGTELVNVYSKIISELSNTQTSHTDDSGSWSLLSSSTTEQDEPMNLCIRDNSIQGSATNISESISSSGSPCPSNQGRRRSTGMGLFPQVDSLKFGYQNQEPLGMQQQQQNAQQHLASLMASAYIRRRSQPDISNFGWNPESPDNQASQGVHSKQTQLYTSTPLRILNETNGISQASSHPMSAPRILPSEWPIVQSVRDSALASDLSPSSATTAVADDIRSRSSSGQLPRRRRVGWRGVAMCAACGLVCAGMDQLNVHYEATHSHLLAMEWRMAQYSNTKSSKLLFQAQLDRLRSEKAMRIERMSTQLESSSPLVQSDEPFSHSTRRLSTSSDNSRSLSESKSTSSRLSLLQPSPPSESICTGIPVNTTEDNTSSISTSTKAESNSVTASTVGDGSRVNKGYPCPSCSYTAKWPTELQKHVMVHANSRPFVCSVCSTSYKWSWDLGRHFSNAHPSLLNPYKRQSGQSRGDSGMSAKAVLAKRRRSLPI